MQRPSSLEKGIVLPRFGALLVLLPLTLPLFLSSFSNPAIGLCAAAFPLRAVVPSTNTAPATKISPQQFERNRKHHHYTTKGFLAATPVCEEETNATDVGIEVSGSSGWDIDEDELLASSSSLASALAPPVMELVRKGNRLELSPSPASDYQSPVVLLDGLSPDTWKASKPMRDASTPATTPSSFSSLVLQTRVPSVPIQSFPLGNFLVPSSPGDESAVAADRHKHKFLAAARLNRYWMGPKFGGAAEDPGLPSDDSEIPVDTQFLLVEIEQPSSADPCYALMMPLVDGGFRSSLEPSSSTIGDDRDETPGSHRLTLVSYSESGDTVPDRDENNPMMNAMYVAVHDDPYELLKLGFREVSGVLGGAFRTLDQKTIPSEFVNSFGWCSWDAFYSKVHPSGILKGIECLSDAGIPVKNVILDDGWQQVSPPYLHQQEEADNGGKTSSLAASLSLSGSSDIMPPPNSKEFSSTGSAAAAIATAPAEESTSAFTALASSAKSLFQNPVESLSNLGGSLFGVIAGGVTHCYQKYVENAPTGSFPNRLWTFLARYSPLNYGLWKFFDSETDFGRQLNDFHPNWKFLDETEENASTQQIEVKNKNMALKDLVASLKNDWKVNRVYCWHSIHGYWRGVSPELGKSIGIDVTQVRTRPSDHLLRIEPEMAFDPPSLFGVGLIGEKGDLQKFYKHLHEPLVEAGVDGVKVDVQSGITAAGMRGKGLGSDCPPLAKLYTQAMEESVSQRFLSSSTTPNSASSSNTKNQAVECINCMCHSTENLYRYKQTAVARASDDFYPARPESHSVHLVNVAYNSLFLGEICLPDWDMFHSQHSSAELHAAARAIGGCPVYVSDVPGKHNTQLLKKLVLPDGSVLRAQNTGRPTRDCIFADVGKDGTSALKIWNTNRHPSSSGFRRNNNGGGGGVVGAFNVQGVAWNFETNENQVLTVSPQSVVASVRPHDVDTLRKIEDGPFAVWSHRTKSLQILPTGGSSIESPLEPREWEIFTIQPVQINDDDDSSFSVRWAPIGLGDMLNSGGALIHVGRLLDEEEIDGGRGDGTQQTKRTQADITARGPGGFVSYCQPRPSHVLIRNDGLSPTKPLDFHHDGETGLLEFDLPPETIEGKAHHVTVLWENKQ